ncbi:WxcM-like domain-containing protein [Flavobacterium amnicola]|uniref:WxcM-like domain-containing protein n=1 Tax=Flavobacterium amnicola TaxID=2506422 RepID=A0A4Q1K4C3_9FLAO|nr:FdtA/QdtA family cupin domain-containing protein [Flavobacterium amnicola]RXR19271.1 WxcM-like domain-containing protein [Flavobacterium amnicola]
MEANNLVQLINIPVVEDARGNLAFIQEDVIPFEFKRVYYLFDVPTNAYRGGHAHKDQQEFLIPLSGSFEVILDNGLEKKIYFMNKPNVGLLIPTGYWRELQNFSSGAVCLVLASDVFSEDDYIRDYNEFLASKK